MAQVSSGSFTTTASEGRSLTFEWGVDSTSISGNYKDIAWKIYGSGSASGYVMAGNFTVVIDGETVYSSSTRIQLWSGTVVASGTKRIYHGTTGNKTFSASASAGIYAVAVNCSGSGSWELPTIPRYADITKFTVDKVNETSVKVTWSASVACDNVWYSTNNGSSWVEINKFPSFNITGLTANTSYNFKIRVRRQDSQLTTDSSTVVQSTYSYPYITKVGVTDLIIGNNQTLTLYNPLFRTVTVKMFKNSTSGTQLYSGTTSTTSINFAPASSTLYASIPSATSGKAVYSCIYSTLSTRSTTGNYTYKIKGTEVPTFSNFTYKDTNSTVTEVTGNDQVLVKGLSTLQVTISSANKMVANNSATGKNYLISIDNLSDTKNYSTSDIISNLGSITSSGTKRLNVRAYDSRNLSTLAYKDITVYDYAKPVINASITRLNNFEAETTIKVSGTYSRLNIGGTDKNTITSIQYRYREAEGTWSDYVNLTSTLNNGKFTCNDVVISLDNTKSFEFEIQATDKLQTNTANVVVDIGQAIFFISTNNKACYINGEPIKLGYREPAKLVNGDYDTMCGIESGFYRSTSVTNAPYTQAGQTSSTNWFYITQIAHNDKYLVQIASPFFDNGLYYRNCLNGTWSEWKRTADAKWTQIASYSNATAGNTTVTVSNLTKYNELLVTVSPSSNVYRVLESSVIPIQMLLGTTALEGNGTHQIVFGGATSYYGGLSYKGNNQLIIYVGNNISVKVFAR